MGDTGRGSEGRPNAGFVITNDGVVVIDALASPQHAEQLAQAIGGVTRQPIKWLVLTHHHPDHAPHHSLAILAVGKSRFSLDPR